jgi:hypothetical protein
VCSDGDFAITSGGDGHQGKEPQMLKVGLFDFSKI